MQPWSAAHKPSVGRCETAAGLCVFQTELMFGALCQAYTRATGCFVDALQVRGPGADSAVHGRQCNRVAAAVPDHPDGALLLQGRRAAEGQDSAKGEQAFLLHPIISSWLTS